MEKDKGQIYTTVWEYLDTDTSSLHFYIVIWCENV